MNKLQIEKLIDESSSKIAEKANRCCYRSDGWEEEIKLFTRDIITSIINTIIQED